MEIRKLCLTLSMLLLSGVAVADSTSTSIPAPAKVIAPSSTTATKSTYDWTGVYVGGFVGGASGTSTNTQGPIDSNGQGTFATQNSYSYQTSASFIGGGTVGYNWQIGKSPYLVGLEGEYGFLDMKGSSADPNNNYSYVSSKNTLNIGGSYGYGVVGGRIGYTIDRALFYVKSGAVFTNTQANYNAECCGHTTAIGTSSNSNSVGYAIGGGVEYALPFDWSKNISVKTEYLYLGINRTQSASNTDPNANPGFPTNAFTTTNTINGISTAKIGVNYKF